MAARKEQAYKQTAQGQQSAMDVLVAYMKRNPKAVYADAQAACLEAGYKVYPIMWGRAQVMLGRVTARPKGTRSAAGVTTVKRSPGRPRREPLASEAGERRVVLPISGPDDLATWQRIIEGLNEGRKVALQYDGQNWLLAML